MSWGERKIAAFAAFDVDWGIVFETLSSSREESLKALLKINEADAVPYLSRMIDGTLKIHAIEINVGEPVGLDIVDPTPPKKETK